MLKELCPKVFKSYLSLPLLGPVLNDYEDWLSENGYQRRTRKLHIRKTVGINNFFQRRNLCSLKELTPEDMHGCWLWYHKHKPYAAGAVRVLQQYLEQKKLLSTHYPKVSNPFFSHLQAYANYLSEVRGIQSQTIHQHLFTSSQFLEYLKNKQETFQLSGITRNEIENFVTLSGERLGRGTLQHVVSRLRCFLRFLQVSDKIPPDLDTQIDTPRLYRMEKLPHALPWETVTTFLNSIDRENPIGLRDYTMFFLIASYGLRSSDIVALTLDDINWRKREILISQRKTGYPLVLPLTDKVGAVLFQYLRVGRPHLPYRELFLRVRAPYGPLKHTAVPEAFQAWSRRSGLEIPFQGPHCLRHSYAIHLLRQGISVKTIGDLLGHRVAESTCVYLRFAIEDLREVALSLPRNCALRPNQEVQL